jgi:hypothetical protein
MMKFIKKFWPFKRVVIKGIFIDSPYIYLTTNNGHTVYKLDKETLETVSSVTLN